MKDFYLAVGFFVVFLMGGATGFYTKPKIDSSEYKQIIFLKDTKEIDKDIMKPGNQVWVLRDTQMWGKDDFDLQEIETMKAELSIIQKKIRDGFKIIDKQEEDIDALFKEIKKEKLKFHIHGKLTVHK